MRTATAAPPTHKEREEVILWLTKDVGFTKSEIVEIVVKLVLSLVFYFVLNKFF